MDELGNHPCISYDSVKYISKYCKEAAKLHGSSTGVLAMYYLMIGILYQTAINALSDDEEVERFTIAEVLHEADIAEHEYLNWKTEGKNDKRCHFASRAVNRMEVMKERAKKLNIDTSLIPECFDPHK